MSTPIEPIKQSPPAGTHTSSRPPNRDLHFDLSWLGPAHETEAYTLHIGGRRHPLVRYTPETLAASSAAGSPTHVAKEVAVHPDTPQLLYVTGPNNPDGFPTLASVCHPHGERRRQLFGRRRGEGRGVHEPHAHHAHHRASARPCSATSAATTTSSAVGRDLRHGIPVVPADRELSTTPASPS